MNVCAKCDKPLKTIREIHVVCGELFCSKECAIDYWTNDIIVNAAEQAKECYDNTCEIITPDEILEEDA